MPLSRLIYAELAPEGMDSKEPVRSAVTWYLVFKRDVGFGSIGASGKQNRVRVRFPRPQTDNKTPLNRTFHHFGVPTYIHTLGTRRERERETRDNRKIDQVAYFGIQKEGSTPTPLLGIEPEARPFALCVGS